MNDTYSTPADRLLVIRSRAQVHGACTGSAVLTDLLARLQVPVSLLGGRRIASQACSLLRRSLQRVPTEQRPAMRAYICELRWIIRHAVRLALLLYDDDKDRQLFLSCGGGNPYVRRGALEHGLCCLLWERYNIHMSDSFPPMRPQFDALCQEALLAHMTSFGYWTQSDDWPSSPDQQKVVRDSMYRRTLAIRHFVMRSYRTSVVYRQALAEIPPNASRAEMMTTLRRIRRGLPTILIALEQELDRNLASILSLLKIIDNPASLHAYTSEGELDRETEVPTPSPEPQQTIYEVECHSEQNSGDEAEVGGEDGHAEEGSAEEDGEDECEGGNAIVRGVTYTRFRWSDEEKGNCVEAGIHPADALPVQRLHLSTHRFGDSRAWLAMQHQNLSLSFRNLAIEEFGVAFQILESQAQHDLCSLEIFVLAKVVAARGLTLATTRSLEIRSDRPAEVDHLTFFLPPVETAQPEWLLPSVPIPYAQERGAHEGCHPVVKDFVTPDYWNIAGLVRRLLAMKFPGWKGEPVQLFADPVPSKKHPATYSQRLKKTLAFSNSDRGPSLAGRVAFDRLGRILWQRIYDQTTGNSVLATYATLRKDRAGEVGRYYATPAVQRVQQAELAAVASIDKELRTIGYDALVDLALTPSNSFGYLGSPMCPTLDAVGRFLAQQVATIAATNEILRTREDIEAIIARHNAFTMLTFCAVTIGTCHRPTHGAVPDLDEIDISSGFVSMADKGSAKARLGVAADASIAQLQAYRAYVETFDFVKSFGARPELSFFFIDLSGAFLTVSPATLKQQSLPFVPNFARHVVKTILSERCEAGDERLCQEWIAALLGHFVEGEEPFGPCSSFNYLGFAVSMRAALGDLLQKIEFLPIDILGRKITVHEAQIQRLLKSATAKSDRH